MNQRNDFDPTLAGLRLMSPSFRQALNRARSTDDQRRALMTWIEGLGTETTSVLELLDARLVEVLRSAAVVSDFQDRRGFAPAGYVENLADDMRTWRAAGCPVFGEPPR